ncbi:MAG: acetate--CoA ligase [Gaiellaceae bacterium]
MAEAMTTGPAIETILLEERRYEPPPAFVAQANARADIYDRSFEEFWESEGRERVAWFEDFQQLYEWEQPYAKWYVGGKLNVTYNCVDRHVEAGNGEKVAYHWEGEPEDDRRTITFADLQREVVRFANALKKLGVKKGTPVGIYMGMVPELPVAMLACARLGAPHTVVFGGFSADSLSGRLNDMECELLITQDEGLRNGAPVPLKGNADAALAESPTVKQAVVFRRTGGGVEMQEGRDLWWHDVIEGESDDAASCPCEPMDSEDLLYLLYTSGTTAKPKGIVHTTAGYLVGVAATHHYIFDVKPDSVYWCAADIGWVTGHSYIVYGPLANGATSLMFEGVPNWPDASRLWQVVDKYQVEILYTAPTALRALMREGDDWVQTTSRASLKLLGTVGEPINPEAWGWYHRVVGEGRCPIVDTWWQTETGGILISPLPGATDLKPGSATKPLFGVRPAVIDGSGQIVTGAAEGALVITDSWPGQMRTVWGDHERFFQTYFTTYPGYYFSGDGCRRDEDGYYWITGRIDDVINVSGHRLGTAEIESALVAHHQVAEAAVVGMPHDIKGQGIYAYVTVNSGCQPDEALRRELVQWVRKEIGPIASPDVIQFAPALPKTRSGKIMRRILRKIAEGDVTNLGDTSTLADPAVVDQLVEDRPLASAEH